MPRGTDGGAWWGPRYDVIAHGPVEFGGAVLARGTPGNRGQHSLVRDRGLRCGFYMGHRGADHRYWPGGDPDQETDFGAAECAACPRRLSQRPPIPSSASLLKSVEQVVAGAPDHNHRD